MSAGRLVGRVITWKPYGAYGFIRVGPLSYFVHRRAIGDGSPLRPGEWVTFTPEQNPRGPRAIAVERLPTQCPKCEADLPGPTCAACGFQLDP